MTNQEIIKALKKRTEKAKSDMDSMPAGESKFDAYFFHETCVRELKRFNDALKNFELRKNRAIEIINH